MFTLLIALISSLFLFNPDGDRINNKVGDLAADHLLPGSPISYVKWGNSESYYDVNGWKFYKNESNDFKRINKSVTYSINNDEEFTCIEYEHFYEFMSYTKYYDSKGRLDSIDMIEDEYEIKYNEDNLVAEIITCSCATYGKSVLKYNENGHCISVAFYNTVDGFEYLESPEPIFNKTPESVTYYTILKVDKHGNWISRKSDKGEIEERTIVYRNYKSKQ